MSSTLSFLSRPISARVFLMWPTHCGLLRCDRSRSVSSTAFPQSVKCGINYAYMTRGRRDIFNSFMPRTTVNTLSRCAMVVYWTTTTRPRARALQSRSQDFSIDNTKQWHDRLGRREVQRFQAAIEPRNVRGSHHFTLTIRYDVRGRFCLLLLIRCRRQDQFARRGIWLPNS